MLLLVLTTLHIQAQIIIGGSVYGGGNEGKVGGNTTVTLRAGDIDKVFGGARMADIDGRAFVHLDGEHASDYMLINYVYGGNDISGTIGTFKTVPDTLTRASANGVDKTWNAFVRISSKLDATGEPATDAQKIYIGQLFAGGNGDYDYANVEGVHTIYKRGTTEVVATTTTGDFVLPDLTKTYLEILGGSIVYAFGGGNNATVKEKTMICVDNPSVVVNSIKVKDDNNNDVELLNQDRINKMGYNPGYTYPTSAEFQIGSFFGGNNKATMAIRPTWKLKSGKIRNLYSGGNEGDMTYADGLLLDIPKESTLEVDNLYGGCRKADVCPGGNKQSPAQAQELKVYDDAGNLKYSFPQGFSARVIVEGGHVNNVYGGNDISGKVYGGNAVGIRTTVYGDVYGGGNGSYPYTDNAELADDPTFGDLFYGSYTNGLASVDALNAFRPNAEQVSVRLYGESAANPTIIHGSVYLGGNSATLATTRISDPKVELKIGSNVIAENVFLGNNGANMIQTHEKDANHYHEGVLRTYQRQLKDLKSAGLTTIDYSTNENALMPFSSINMQNADIFAKYMDGCAMSLMPSIEFDSKAKGDIADYEAYSTYIGSFYCGGNVGSMIRSGTTNIEFTHKVIIYNKVVGGCNNAYVPAVSGFNAAFNGGLIGSDGSNEKPDERPDINGNLTYIDANGNIKDRLVLNLSGLKIMPKRWNDSETKLVWNTIDADDRNPVESPTDLPLGGNATDDDLNRRFDGGNIYGGCYNSGVVNGNVVININATIVDRTGEHGVFDEVSFDDNGEDMLYGNTYKITKRNSGVIRGEQGMDVLGSALNVFGGGKGKDTEIWGSATVNLKAGYTFQIFGGSEQGAIGKGVRDANTGELGGYSYDAKYSTYVNLMGPDNHPGVPKSQDTSDDMAQAEFLYGGGFEGPIEGNTQINLGNGRIFNSFAGSCNADIYGHTETYVGRQPKADNPFDYKDGFPWIRDHIYGGNDLGGNIKGEAVFATRIRDDVKSLVDQQVDEHYGVSAYMEYTQGRVVNIFGGCYGDYNYQDPAYKVGTTADCRVTNKPYLRNAFINIRPIQHQNSVISKVFGAGQGYKNGDRDGDKSQDQSYVLIDIPNDIENFANMEIFGAGAYDGLGMRYTADETFADNFDPNKVSAVIDLLRGKVGAAYGGSYEEGVTRRTWVNVPDGSTIKIGSIFGGAYGLNAYKPCDVYEAHVNYATQSEDAYLIYDPTKSNELLKGNIYGGNNFARRTLYGKVDISAPVRQKHPDYEELTRATVFGAGCGPLTWNEYTEVNLNAGAEVWEVYGGAEAGSVMSPESVQEYIDKNPLEIANWDEAWTLGEGYNASNQATGYVAHKYTSLVDNPLVRTAEMDDRAVKTYKYNTNVIIREGAYVGNYAYGGGLGDINNTYEGAGGSGDVYGTTYIALLGGRVNKDIYAAGTVGAVYNYFGAAGFTASANAYIEGGTARNVYGGGWRGSVGYHAGAISEPTTNDIPGETHVVIGKINGTSFIDGLPAIERNAYGGGEGGAVYGTANITLNNGFIGYRRFNAEPTTDTDLTYIKKGSDYYQEKLHDETWKGDGTNRLYDSGSIFGGGYIDNSSVDITNVKMYDGHVRNALFGGGEIAAIGRGVITASGTDNSVRSLQGIYKAGKTNVELLGGHVHRNVFGGGRGYNNLGEGGTLYSDGFVFGQTEVHIFGGEVGTAEGVELGQGNVFGGGDIGYVYSAYENESHVLCFGKKSGDRYDNGGEGYYYEYENDSFVTDPETSEKIPTEDCKVLVEPHCRVTASNGGTAESPTAAVTINGHEYFNGDYVTTEDLNHLGNKNDTNWGNLDPTGIIIHNAVFAGGNTSAGSAAVYANATSVFGNATASIHDVYHRDLITLGTGNVGGLYGDGNLTFVDGYRGLNITNYGTDYYTISPEISITDYHTLPAREAAYYELRYKCIQDCTDKEGTHYYKESEEHPKASTLSADDILTLFDTVEGMIVKNAKNEDIPNPSYWQENGVCSIYAGRLMNTIQRADFCGVFGSRMVMKGAQDRVPEIVDYTNYTINRVREVSLNKQRSVISDDLTLKSGATQATNPDDQNPDDFVDKNKAIHGNYFGIYNIVNFLGGLSSDERFDDKRRTDSQKPEHTTTGNETYLKWKEDNINNQKRNNGSSLNKVALASGVYLELTTEKSTGNELKEKDWGYITGIIELDLINVQTGVGGGFVYAKNEHRTWTYSKKKHATLTALNDGAVTQKDYTYSSTYVEWETSGNFVHSSQTIIDDCYNISGKYQGTDAVPAHYWYIKGQVYVYEQEISAYTGAPNAYSETVDIPLTITAASHGTMKLLDVKPNYYAYYSAPGVKLESGKKIVINEVEYHLNDPISYWDYQLLTSAEKNLFVPETYVCITDCKIGSNTYRAGDVFLPTDYTTLESSASTQTIDNQSVKAVEQIVDEENNVMKWVPFTYAFRTSNNLSHENGYILTYRVNNPLEWNTWYTKADSQTHEKQRTAAEGFEDGPTYYLSSGQAQVLGQRDYKVGNLISKNIEDTYQSIKTNHSTAVPSGQATFVEAYLVTKEATLGNTHLNPGSAVSATDAANLTGSVEKAYICTSTIELSKTEFIYLNTKMTESEKTAYYNRFKDGTAAERQIAKDINELIVPAYYCTTEGLYGGNYYEAGKNYRGLEAWCSMSETDRSKFAFNYDALDLFINADYSGSEGEKYKYDGAGFTTAEQANTNQAGYSLPQPLDYTATYHGTETATYNTVTLQNNKEYTRAEYEKLPNEQRHYAAVNIQGAGKYYVVNKPLLAGSTPYAVGTTVTKDVYDRYQNYVTELNVPDTYQNSKIYFCRESYKVGHNGSGVEVSAAPNVTGGETGTYTTSTDPVPVGLVITQSDYNKLVAKNKQVNFSIHGISPTETSSLYVSRNSDIFDLSADKIITVIYQYDYEEVDATGNVTPISERHVVNIRIKFKSGVPSVEDIRAPQIVIPGDKVALREPAVTPGAYEVTGGGWKLFEKISDAESHTNGVDYNPQTDQLYWYQNGYYVAYYAKTYLGETYSNHVPVSVANYHDLKKVMEDPTHYHIDKPVTRDHKIYINDYSRSSQNGLDLLKGLVDLTYGRGTDTYGAFESPANIAGAQNLDLIMRTNINHPASWTSIASNSGECFSGTLHGDGYYIEGENLDHSLFGNLCGDVYNLGVMGSFTEAGIANTGTGYVENCWVKSSATSGFPEGTRAVFGNPSAAANTKQIVNCYYPETNGYKVTTDDGGHGLATPMSLDAFHDGMVAYNLNGFYLYKRYCDQKVTSGLSYQYYTVNNNTLSAPLTKYYADNMVAGQIAYCSSGHDSGKYVEDRFAYGDFQYANGEIPSSENERAYVDTDGKTSYYPIWPDDYLFFGQMLTYGWDVSRPHEEVPSHLYKSGYRLVNSDLNNRVYRAPAYFGNATMSVAYFNPNFNLVAYSKPQNSEDTNLHPAYPGMTAIDFYGHNDGDYALGQNASGFYPPLLDDGGLQSIVNRDQTRNLLVYAPTSTANKKTYDVLKGYFTEHPFSEYFNTSDVYKRVTVAPTSTIFGHLVVRGESGFTTSNDHLLVDKQDFNCPIPYTMGTGFRMWYQREPDNYVTITNNDKTIGWEGLCLPFAAELVSTQDKGEITHFYGDNELENKPGSKTGHEYWLREYNGGSVSGNEFVGKFNAIAAGSNTKNYTNTYLWDTYYSKDSSKDKNEDIYQQGYYSTSHDYASYPYNAVGTPYLVGFPGASYYEFDLSGNWTPQNRYQNVTIANPGRQTISFVSGTGISIGESDSEIKEALKDNKQTKDGYTYVPNYKNKKLETENTAFVLASDGGSYVKNAENAVVSAFRPYIVEGSFNGTRGTELKDKIERVVFDNDSPQILLPKDDRSKNLNDGTMDIYAKRNKVVVESNLRYVTDVRIVNVAGMTLSSFSIEPGETIETRVESAGVYIVYADNGKYVKKVIVK
jgi:hypothetical protein